MANFATHIGVGTVVSGALATLTVATGLIPPDDLVAVTLAGVLGSVLPDIDLEDSRPSRAMFSGLAIFASFAVLFTVAARFSVVEMLIVWLGTLVFVRYGLHALFHSTAVHRGIWHSILAATFSAVAAAAVFAHVLGRSEGIAWLAAGFVFVGFITHLVLDEIYSVDVMDTRVKASFGTALKWIDRRHPAHTGAMVLALALAAFVAPSPKAFVDGIASRDLWAGLQRRLLPEDKWFGLIGGTGAVAATPDAGSNLTTGSLPEPATK